MFYVRLMVTIKPKPIVAAENKKRKDSKHTATENHQTRNYKPARKQQSDSSNPYLSITTLNVNGLNSPIKRHGVAE